MMTSAVSSTAPVDSYQSKLPPHLDAIERGDVGDLRRLIERKSFDVNARTGPARANPLMCACLRGSPLCVKALLEAGADPDIQYDDYREKKTALMMTLLRTPDDHSERADEERDGPHDGRRIPKRYHMDIITQLVKASANLNLQDAEGRTALHIAAILDCDNAREIVGLLLDRGADRTIKTVNGDTPLSLANRTMSPTAKLLAFSTSEEKKDKD